jgi:hypothetical protein
MDINADNAALLTKINEAVAAANEAEKTAEAAKATAEAAKAEVVSRSRVVGELLLEAKKRHPKVADFEAFLKRVDGLKLSRAYDYLRLVGGRVTDEELREEARERKRKSRAKKLPPPAPSLPKPEPPGTADSFRDIPHVTESPEVSAERKAQMAALDLADGQKATKASARALAEFMVACRTWLPKVTVEADRQKARLLVSELTSNKGAEAA